MAEILQTKFSNAFIFFTENYCLLIQIRTKFVLKWIFDNKAALIQAMAWHWAGAPFTNMI